MLWSSATGGRFRATYNVPRIEAFAQRHGLIQTEEGGLTLRFCSQILGIEAEPEQFRPSHLSNRCPPTARLGRDYILNTECALDR